MGEREKKVISFYTSRDLVNSWNLIGLLDKGYVCVSFVSQEVSHGQAISHFFLLDRRLPATHTYTLTDWSQDTNQPITWVN